MGFRYQKRVNLGDGVGVNISKSGLSTSYRTKYGSIGSRGFSVRTGIPGLSFRSSFGKGKGKNDAMVSLIAWLLVGVVIVGAVVIYNLARLLIWLLIEIYHLGLRKYYQYKLKKEQSTN